LLLAIIIAIGLPGATQAKEMPNIVSFIADDISQEDSVGIELSIDDSGRQLGAKDIVFVYAKVVDKNGTIVPDSTMPVTFSIEGSSAELIGANPIPAEAGVASILLKICSSSSITIVAQSGNVKTKLKVR